MLVIFYFMFRFYLLLLSGKKLRKEKVVELPADSISETNVTFQLKRGRKGGCEREREKVCERERDVNVKERNINKEMMFLTD